MLELLLVELSMKKKKKIAVFTTTLEERSFEAAMLQYLWKALRGRLPHQ